MVGVGDMTKVLYQDQDQEYQRVILCHGNNIYITI